MLYVVRHGQSLWNSENRFTGWTDIDLNNNGIGEANDVGNIIKDLNINIDYIFTSDLKRSINTTKIIEPYLHNFNQTPINTQLLNKRAYSF